jgi:hypothetical protein
MYMMIGYDIYSCFTMEHFGLRQRMTLTTKIYYSRLYSWILKKRYILKQVDTIFFGFLIEIG